MHFPTPSVRGRTRREFLKAAAAAGAYASLPGARAFGSAATGARVSPNERIRLAVIGIGNQGNGDRKAMVASGLCEVVALCDVDLRGEHTQEAQQAHPEARRFTDFRRMFDAMADGIDAVLVASPDHTHFCAAMLAMSLGKPVYVEKPLAHTFGECERLIAMAARSGVVTQMGNQGHSGANYFQFKAWSEAGVIRNVTRITAYMNEPRRWHGWGRSVSAYPTDPLPEGMDWDAWTGPAPEHPFSRRLHPQEWRSWFDYGSGAFGDWAPHLLDTAHRFLELGLPTEVEAVRREGANPLVYPQASTIRFAFPARGAKPPCTVTWYDGVDNRPPVEAAWGRDFVDPETHKVVRKAFRPDKPGKILYSDTLIFQGGSHGSPLHIIPRESYLEVRKALPKFPQKNSNHFENFLLACKGEEPARSPFSVSGPLCQVFTLGMIAQRLGGTLRFDRSAKQLAGNPAASALLDPAPRAGWEEFYRL